MLMRASCSIHCGDVDAAIEIHEMMPCRLFTHVTPTLFNPGTPTPQTFPCFLLTMKFDSIHGIYDPLKTCAMMSKDAGGSGLAISNARASGPYIRGLSGHSHEHSCGVPVPIPRDEGGIGIPY